MHDSSAFGGVASGSSSAPRSQHHPALADFERDGHAVLPPGFDHAILARLDDLRAECDRLLAEDARASGSGRPRAGSRGIIGRSPLIRDLARSTTLRGLIESIIGPDPFVARSIVFDKNPDANWDVPWHQDTTIAVREKRDAPGYGPWSVKTALGAACDPGASADPPINPILSSSPSEPSLCAAGARASTPVPSLRLIHVPHVQPPAATLRGMVTARIHLDDCDAETGALRVVPGSHHQFIPATQTDPSHHERAARLCEVRAGGLMLMRPLLLHASRKSTRAQHRRVIHLEYAAHPLPHGLQWAEH